MPEIRYAIDSDVLINFSRNLPRDIFEGVWSHLDDYVRSRRILVHRMVAIEVAQKGERKDDANLWIQSIPDDLIVEIDDDQGEFIDKMGREDKHIAWRLTNSEYRNSADPFVIALGKVFGCCVVTNEKMTEHKIPSICARYSIETIKPHAMMRVEHWRFP